MRPKIQLFAQKLIRNLFPTRCKLLKLGFFMNGDCPFCHITEENIDHIFKDWDFDTNIWNTIINNCPTPINTNLTIVNRLDSLWINKSFYKNFFGNVLEKIIMILWAIWTHRNNIVFKNDKCNSIYVLELTKRVMYEDENYKIALIFLLCQKLHELTFLMQVKGITLRKVVSSSIRMD